MGRIYLWLQMSGYIKKIVGQTGSDFVPYVQALRGSQGFSFTIKIGQFEHHERDIMQLSSMNEVELQETMNGMNGQDFNDIYFIFKLPPTLIFVDSGMSIEQPMAVMDCRKESKFQFRVTAGNLMRNINIKFMKGKNKRHLQNQEPAMVSVVNLEGLRLMSRRLSERTPKNYNKCLLQTQKHQISANKTSHYSTNRIYFKQRKEREDELDFSDFRIKSPGAPFTKSKSFSSTHDQESNINSSQDMDPSQSAMILKKKEAVQMILAGEPKGEQKEPVKIKFNLRISYQERKSKSRAEQRVDLSFLKPSQISMKGSRSFKNYKKVQLSQRKQSESDKLDGWATQYPMYEYDKKMDINEYAQVDKEGIKSYFSERIKENEKLKIKRSRKL